jgi:murein DD-endopeptidase MepM/ murein hydrolase activator NlpD
MPDNVPGSFPPTTTINNAGGNMVVTEVGPGQYIAYTHMVRGSVTVRVGDVVQRGQKLGKLGNSGNSDAPHLHFQVMNKPSLVDADPLPFVFDTMRLDGQFRGTAERLDESLVSEEPLRFNRNANGNRKRQMPLTGDLLRFP